MNDDLVIRLLRDRPAQFAQMVGFEKMTDDLHGKWIQRMVFGHDDYTLQAHRGSYKTTALQIAIAQLMILYGNKNIMFLRKTDTDVMEVVKGVKRILDHPVTQSCYLALTGRPLGIVKDTSTELTTSAYTAPRGAAQLLGLGIGGSITGKHADIIITDDIINIRDRVSAAERERTRTTYMELRNVLIPGGRFINTGTPWHKEDAFTLMPQPDKYDCYSTGMLSQAEIANLRSGMSASLFAANYELKHIAQEDALFGEAPKFTEDARYLVNGIAHVDAAYGGGDYTAFTAANKIGNTIYVYGKLWSKHVDNCMDSIKRDCTRLMVEPIYCETNGDKGYLSRELHRIGLQTRPYAEKMNKFHKISTFLRKWWTNIVFLYGTDPEYISQIQDYTDNAEHDDAPDSAACVCRILDRR